MPSPNSSCVSLCPPNNQSDVPSKQPRYVFQSSLTHGLVETPPLSYFVTVFPSVMHLQQCPPNNPGMYFNLISLLSIRKLPQPSSHTFCVCTSSDVPSEMPSEQPSEQPRYVFQSSLKLGLVETPPLSHFVTAFPSVLCLQQCPPSNPGVYF